MTALRFVVLHHGGVDVPHFDLMIETAPSSPLATWQSPKWPVEGGDYFTKAADHRQAYLTYEGPVSDNRGSVRRIAEGTCRSVHLGEGLLEVTFTNGAELTLVQDSAEQWLCWVIPDDKPLSP